MERKTELQGRFRRDQARQAMLAAVENARFAEKHLLAADGDADSLYHVDQVKKAAQDAERAIVALCQAIDAKKASAAAHPG